MEVEKLTTMGVQTIVSTRSATMRSDLFSSGSRVTSTILVVESQWQLTEQLVVVLCVTLMNPKRAGSCQ